MNNPDIVLRVLERWSNDQGWIETRVIDLVLETRLSRETIKRALSELVKVGLIERRSKSGRDGGLIIRLTNGSEIGSKSAQKSSTRNAFQDSVSEPTAQQTETESCAHENGSQTAQPEPEPPSPAWFVCCVWYDEKGQMWCHGTDGYETYMPCATKEDAMELAEKHSRMYHKDKSARYGVLPRVDVCETIGKGKSLHYSYNSLGGLGG